MGGSFKTMGFRQAGEIKYFTFERLEELGVINAVFTRLGGVSLPPFASLNVGGTVGDQPELVKKNLQRALRGLNLSEESIFDVWQVHGDHVVFAERPRPKNEGYQKADVILTNREAVTLLMRFADCVPILLYDPGKRVIGLAHAGWKGTILQIAKKAVEMMVTRYGTNPADIIAALGPSIAQHHYLVGPEIVMRVQSVFGRTAKEVLQSTNGTSSSSMYFDLWKANQLVLNQAGVRRVEVAGLCTACHIADWYSHRAEGGKTGRFGALIALKSA